MSLKKLFNQMNPKDREEKKIDFTEETSEEVVSEAPEEAKPVEEWIWVTGYKGMDKNMKCRNNFQYEIGKTYDMPEDAVIEECSSGFHMCLKLNDVFSYVNIGDNNRFFEVRALVRKSDKDRYQAGASRNPYTYTYMYKMDTGLMEKTRLIDKLAAKSIEIVRELTMDEILKPLGCHEWEEAYKKMALAIGVDAAKSTMKIDKLVELGYSLPFANWLVNNKKYYVAKAVGSQADLSMDMKCLMIMNG